MALARNKKLIHRLEGSLQLFIGLGAAISGAMMMIEPSGSAMGLPPDMLEGSPFTNFFIPGLLLLLVNGLGNVFAALLSFKQHALAGFAGIFFGFALIVWMFVQVSMIGGGHWLQNMYFILGVVEAGFGILIREGVRSEP